MGLAAAGNADHYYGFYPVPKWKPAGGFRVDRAVMYAFMRQESAFKVRAKSRAGARGLMQLMPATASYISKRRFRGRARNKLFDPALNLALGQKYLRYLIRHKNVQGDMFLLAAAYNGGPGNLGKWRRRVSKLSTDADQHGRLVLAWSSRQRARLRNGFLIFLEMNLPLSPRARGRGSGVSLAATSLSPAFTLSACRLSC